METFITGTMTDGRVDRRRRLRRVNTSDGAVDDAIRDAQRLAVVKNRVRGDLP
jgi:hypothetical protein